MDALDRLRRMILALSVHDTIKHHTVLAFPELSRGVCRVKTGTIHKKGGKGHKLPKQYSFEH
uniref:Uncharacterized protein n=1 Tax=Magallana gigas TaxID=29159 RepID=K1QW44_MAGGI